MAGDPWDSDPVVQAAPPAQQPVAAPDPTDAGAYANQPTNLQAGGANFAPPFAGAQRDPRDPNIWRGPDGKVAYIGQTGGTKIGADGNVAEVDISGSSNPQYIASYLAQHPEMVAPPQAAAGPSVAPSGGDDPWDADPVVHTAGYEQFQAEQRAASAQAGSSPGTAGIDQSGDALLNGLTLNHADWAKGMMAAAGTYLRNLAGDRSISPADAWAAENDLTHEQDAAFSKEHPLVNFGLALAGGAPIGEGVGSLVGKGAGLISEAAPQVSRWLAGYGLGIPASAAIGAAYGSGADKTDPVGGAEDGALAGTAAGVALPTVGAVGGALLGAGRDAAGGIVAGVQDAVRGQSPGLTPQQAASAQDAATRYLSAKLTDLGITPADVATSPLASRGATVAEALGPDAVADAASIVRRPGAGAQLARDTLQPRQDGRTDRLLSDVASITGVDPTAAQAGVEGLVAQGQVKAAPLYDAVRADANRYMTRDMRQVLQTPAGQQALAATHTDLLNAVPSGGPAPADVGITLDGDGQPTVDKGLRPLAIDMMKRNLDDATRFQPFGGAQAGNANQAVDAARDAWVSSARQAVPSYADALDAAGDYKTVQSAYKASQGMLFGTGQGRSVQDVQNVWDGLGSDAERDAVRSRFAADIMAKAEAGNLTPGLLQKPGVAGKLQLAFGQDAADALVTAAGQEGSLSASGSRMMPGTGSITSDALNHGDAQDQALDTLRAAGHAVHRLKEGKPIAAFMAGVAHVAEKGANAARTPFNQATRDELARLYLGDASGFGVTFQPQTNPAAAYLQPGALGTWLTPGGAGAGATAVTRRDSP